MSTKTVTNITVRQDHWKPDMRIRRGVAKLAAALEQTVREASALKVEAPDKGRAVVLSVRVTEVLY